MSNVTNLMKCMVHCSRNDVEAFLSHMRLPLCKVGHNVLLSWSSSMSSLIFYLKIPHA